MSDAEFYRAWRDAKKERRKLATNCPGCNIKEPKRIPTKLLPGQRCKVCGHVRPRTEEP